MPGWFAVVMGLAGLSLDAAAYASWRQSRPQPAGTAAQVSFIRFEGTELTNRQLDYVSKTEGAAKSLLGLLNDILDFSKVEAGKMTLDLEPVPVAALFREGVASEFHWPRRRYLILMAAVIARPTRQ